MWFIAADVLAARTLASIQLFVCPECGDPASEVLEGRELQVFALEIQEMSFLQPVIQPTTRLVEVRQNILKQNDIVARELRHRFHAAGVYVVSLVSSPGSGKTAFLEAEPWHYCAPTSVWRLWLRRPRDRKR